MKFSIQISTKNRLKDLALTLSKIRHLFVDGIVECVVFDDGSTDGTSDFLAENYPQIIHHRNEESRGYLYCRNKMLNETKAEFAISLDDDAHFISENPLEKIQDHFLEHPECGLIAFRILWKLDEPEQYNVDGKSERVKGYVGCGHAWRMASWRQIPNYPEWFQFYGEESYASLHLFKIGIEVHYLPSVFILHRVDMQARKTSGAFKTRYKNSLKADYFLYFIFYPWQVIPRKIAYSVAMQLKGKIFNGHPSLIFPLLAALGGVVINIPNIIRERNALSSAQYESFFKLTDTKIYWNP